MSLQKKRARMLCVDDVIALPQRMMPTQAKILRHEVLPTGFGSKRTMHLVEMELSGDHWSSAKGRFALSGDELIDWLPPKRRLSDWIKRVGRFLYAPIRIFDRD
jgi:hypothetical protein